MTKGWCARCKSMQDIANSKLIEFKKGKRIAGQCLVCNTNISAIVKKDFVLEKEPYSTTYERETKWDKDTEVPIKQPPIQPLPTPTPIIPEQEIEKGDYFEPQPKPIEKEIIKDYVEKANENKLLKSNGYKVIKRDYYGLLKAVVVIFFLGILVFSYMSYQDKFISDIDCGNFTCPEIPDCPSCPANTNTCDCKPTTDCDCPDFPDEIQINMSGDSS